MDLLRKAGQVILKDLKQKFGTQIKMLKRFMGQKFEGDDEVILLEDPNQTPAKTLGQT